MVHIVERSGFLVAVATCGLASALATGALLAFFGVSSLMHKVRRGPLSKSQKKAVRLGGSQAGVLIISLLFADFVQGLGFSLSYHWSLGNNANFPLGGPPMVCTAQAVLIQWSDVTAALFTFLITLHTTCLLVLRYRVSQRAFVSTWLLAILAGAIMAFAGPLASSYDNGRPFYVNPDYTASHTSFADAHSQCGSGELYCWISPFHKDARLPLHFLWILITAISSCICYPILFWFIHKGQYIFRSAVSIDSTHSSPSFNSDLDTVALRMLLFPILFCANNILLICYRLADMAGHKWSQGLLVVGVCVYALSGLCDTLLYGITRKVITTPARSTNSPTSLNRPAHVDIPHRTPSKSASPHTPRQMEFGATTEDIDLEAHWKEKPSISYETIELNQYDALEAPLWGPR